MLLTPLRLVLVLQYLTNPSFMVLSTLVRRHDRSFVVHLLEPAINRCLCGGLCSLGVQYRYGRFWSSSDISSPTDVMNWLWLFTVVSNESSIGIYVGLLMFTLFVPNSLTRVSAYSTSCTQLSHYWQLCLQGSKHNWHVIYGTCL